jgi:hypothetical protein
MADTENISGEKLRGVIRSLGQKIFSPEEIHRQLVEL